MPVYQLVDELIFPHPNEAEDDGLLAIGGDLSPERLLLAYRNGIFPWPVGEDFPVFWASPNPRLVLYPQKFKVSKSLKQTIRRKKYQVRFDTNFDGVIKSCAEIQRPDQAGTWITQNMQNAYIKLHELGYAHSVETYLENKLVGGLYGISLGRAFFGESMFAKMSDASKVALFYLVEKTIKWNFDFIDAQVPTKHLLSLGAEEVSRNTFLKLLNKTLENNDRIGNWI